MFLQRSSPDVSILVQHFDYRFVLTSRITYAAHSIELRTDNTKHRARYSGVDTLHPTTQFFPAFLRTFRQIEHEQVERLPREKTLMYRAVHMLASVVPHNQLKLPPTTLSVFLHALDQPLLVVYVPRVSPSFRPLERL